MLFKSGSPEHDVIHVHPYPFDAFYEVLHGPFKHLGRRGDSERQPLEGVAAKRCVECAVFSAVFMRLQLPKSLGMCQAY